jgi:anti-anti-sigma factor
MLVTQPAGSLTISDEMKGPVCIMRVKGKITFGPNVEQLRGRFEALLDAGHNQFVLDLTQVPWMDSAGLGELVACHKRMLAAGGIFKLVLTGKLREWITQLRLPIEVYAGEEEALAATSQS